MDQFIHKKLFYIPQGRRYGLIIIGFTVQGGGGGVATVKSLYSMKRIVKCFETSNFYFIKCLLIG